LNGHISGQEDPKTTSYEFVSCLDQFRR
jgi:hypothetical protein